MSYSLNGIQLYSTYGTDFNSQYNVPDTSLTNNTTLQNNPLYNMTRIIMEGKQTDNIAQHSANDIFLNNGLRGNIDSSAHKLALIG